MKKTIIFLSLLAIATSAMDSDFAIVHADKKGWIQVNATPAFPMIKGRPDNKRQRHFRTLISDPTDQRRYFELLLAAGTGSQLQTFDTRDPNSFGIHCHDTIALENFFAELLGGEDTAMPKTGIDPAQLEDALTQAEVANAQVAELRQKLKEAEVDRMQVQQLEQKLQTVEADRALLQELRQKLDQSAAANQQMQEMQAKTSRHAAASVKEEKERGEAAKQALRERLSEAESELARRDKLLLEGARALDDTPQDEQIAALRKRAEEAEKRARELEKNPTDAQLLEKPAIVDARPQLWKWLTLGGIPAATLISIFATLKLTGK